MYLHPDEFNLVMKGKDKNVGLIIFEPVLIKLGPDELKVKHYKILVIENQRSKRDNMLYIITVSEVENISDLFIQRLVEQSCAIASIPTNLLQSNGETGVCFTDGLSHDLVAETCL